MLLPTKHQNISQKVLELQGEMDESTAPVGDFSVTVLVINRSNKQKISRAMGELRNTVGQPHLVDMAMVPHLSAQRTLIKTDQILYHYTHRKELKE